MKEVSREAEGGGGAARNRCVPTYHTQYIPERIQGEEREE